MTVADVLASEANDITIVDRNAEQLRALQDHLDVRTVLGHASHPDVLQKAGAEVTGSASIIELSFLNGREKLDVPHTSLVAYEQ